MIAETPRLILREITVADAEHAFILNSDPDVLKYTGDAPFESVEKAAEFLSNYSHYRDYGFGRWAMVSKDNGSFLGWCGLKFHPQENEYDLGYRLMKKYWNLGYATEASLASLNLGFRKFNMPEIIARAMKENTASIKVMQKIGMKYSRDFDFDGFPGIVYNMKAENFLMH